MRQAVTTSRAALRERDRSPAPSADRRGVRLASTGAPDLEGRSAASGGMRASAATVRDVAEAYARTDAATPGVHACHRSAAGSSRFRPMSSAGSNCMSRSRRGRRDLRARGVSATSSTWTACRSDQVVLDTGLHPASAWCQLGSTPAGRSTSSRHADYLLTGREPRRRSRPSSAASSTRPAASPRCRGAASLGRALGLAPARSAIATWTCSGSISSRRPRAGSNLRRPRPTMARSSPSWTSLPRRSCARSRPERSHRPARRVAGRRPRGSSAWSTQDWTMIRSPRDDVSVDG